jgi:uncharacterized protein YdcH (DUF465 family)
VVLAEFYRLHGMPTPWPYYNDRCYRTVRALYKGKEPPFVRLGTFHNALDDAMSQATHLIKLLNHAEDRTLRDDPVICGVNG